MPFVKGSPSMSGDRAPDALMWLGFAIGDLEAARAQPGRRVKRLPPDLGRLSAFATDSRYPDDIERVTPIESATAVRQAMAVVRVVREDFERRGVSVAGLEPR
jgi:hypothetical protein